ncbi:SpoIIE family protein phosphatase [Crocinitomix algicola]|uniref:SpoIIE family protein phosphatase n=1 Tax=Crocinitomix algicola TaxID=1740263 RepID=UPI0008343140|nr:SpoIIE family protein phosphatase [Crocinitomix algicola]
MRRIPFTNRVLIALITTVLMVIASAFWVNWSLQNIVTKIEDEAKPNERLVHLKNVLFTVTNAESQVKSYGITLDDDYLNRYNESIRNVQTSIKQLYRTAKNDTAFLRDVRQIDALSQQKFDVLDELLVVQNEQSVSSVFEKVENKVGLVTDVAIPKEKEDRQAGFLNKLFGNRSQAKNQKKVPNYSYSTLNREISTLKAEEKEYENELKKKELQLIQSNQRIMDNIANIVTAIEKSEEFKLQVKIKEAGIEGKFTRNLIAFFCFLSCILLVVAGYTIYIYVKKNDAYKQDLQFSHDEKARINEEILASITYAKRLQTAILPDDKKINRLLPNSFVLYKPKDIVAGDFYWMVEKDDFLYIAVADCTGHGVPGALVSMTCSSALNRSVKEFNLTEPALILDKCLSLIIETFESGDYTVYDGMDISLCRIDRKSNTLQFAGANNHLYYITNGEPKELKADKQSVSRFYADRSFTNHEIKFNSEDLFFLYTDGLQDQFGGPKRKKLMPHRVKSFLLENKDLPYEKQRERLVNAYEEWKGELEQIDDICIWGFRI